jgi:hypothetical protein
MKNIKALREAGLKAEHVAFSFMKRRVQPLMARDTLGYQYTDSEDTTRMLVTKSMMKTLSRGWQDIQGYAALHSLPSSQVLRGSPTEQGTYLRPLPLSTNWAGVVELTQVVVCRMTSPGLSPTQLPPPLDLKM